MILDTICCDNLEFVDVSNNPIGGEQPRHVEFVAELMDRCANIETLICSCNGLKLEVD